MPEQPSSRTRPPVAITSSASPTARSSAPRPRATRTRSASTARAASWQVASSRSRGSGQSRRAAAFDRAARYASGTAAAARMNRTVAGASDIRVQSTLTQLCASVPKALVVMCIAFSKHAAARRLIAAQADAAAGRIRSPSPVERTRLVAQIEVRGTGPEFVGDIDRPVRTTFFGFRDRGFRDRGFRDRQHARRVLERVAPHPALGLLLEFRLVTGLRIAHRLRTLHKLPDLDLNRSDTPVRVGESLLDIPLPVIVGGQ